ARLVPMRGITLGSVNVNPLALAGHGLTVLLAVLGILRLRALARQGNDEAAGALVEGIEVGPVKGEPQVLNADWTPSQPRVKLTDLAVLSFVASLAFMSLEMVAGRLVTRHLGSSIYGWTSVIGVLLGGLSLGNYLGGKIANSIHREHQASWLFL